MVEPIQLRKHQREALERLSNGLVLCGCVGSGKSLTALSYWGQRASVSAYPLDLYVITTARKRDKLEWIEDAWKLGVTSDGSLSPNGAKIIVDSWNNIKKYTHIRNCFFIFDEQRLVGSGEWVKSFYKIAAKNQWLLLSATPGDSWMDYIPLFVAHGFYDNRTEFLERHAIYSRYAKYPKIDRWRGEEYLQRLVDKLLIDMPFDRDTVRHVEMVTVEYDKELFRRVLKERKDPWDGGPIKETGKLAYLLRRASNDHPSRLTKVRELVKTHPKIIIFYNFSYELEALRGLKAEGYTIAEWNGKVHEDVPVGESWLYLVQYAAGAEGWNCIETDTILFYSQNYSYRVLEQAMGRIDRLNTRFVDLYYYRLRSTSGIDLAITGALNRKKDFNERTFLERQK